MSFREALSLVSTDKDVAAYPDGALSLVKVGLEYRLQWQRSFSARSIYVPELWLEPTDTGIRLNLLGQLMTEWSFVDCYVPTPDEWAEYVRYVFALRVDQSQRLELSRAVHYTYNRRVTNSELARTTLCKYIYTTNMILDIKEGKNHV